MAFRIDPEFENHLPQPSPEQVNALALLIETNGPRPGSIVVADILGDRILADGHHTFHICAARRIKLPPEIVYKFPSRELALQWIDDNQEAGRNLTAEQQADRRERRKQREVAARQQGQSLRTIAEAEKVSEKTVRNDLQEATAEGSAVQPTSGVVNSKDGVQRPATKPTILCERCERVGPRKDCPSCLEARAAATKTTRAAPANPPRAKPTKNGEETYNQRLVNECFGKVVAQLDRLAKDKGLADARGVIRMTPAHAGIRRKLDEAQADITKWRKELAKGKP